MTVSTTVNTIEPYMTHTVSIVTVMLSKGSRGLTVLTDFVNTDGVTWLNTVDTTWTSITTGVEDGVKDGVKAFITEVTENVRSVKGDHDVNRTVVYLLPTQTVTEQDEIIVDGNQRPILRIGKGRNSEGVNHLRVVLQ